MDKEIKSFELSIKEEGEEKGSVEAVFSVYNNLDSDGDVVIPGAVKSGFKDNQVPMVFAHKWDQPIGKGVIVENEDSAVFKGSFFMDTEAGKEAYNLVKSMGDLQQWSFGFRVNDSEVGKFKKNDSESEVRYLKDLTVYEVSPVLVGANQETYTLAIKSGEDTVYEKKEVKEETVEVEAEVEATEESSCNCDCKKDAKAMDCDYGNGGKCAKEMEDDKKDLEVSEDDSSVSGKRFSDEVKDVLAALEDLIVRSKAIGLLREKDGRKLSEKATQALRAIQEDLNDAWEEIDEVISQVGTVPEVEEEIEAIAEAEATEVEAPEEISEDVEIEEAEVEVAEEVSEPEEEVSEEEVDEGIDEVILQAQVNLTESLIAEQELEDEI